MSRKKTEKYRIATVAARRVWYFQDLPASMGGFPFGTDPDELIINPDFDDLMLGDLDLQAAKGRIHSAETLK